MRYRKKPVVIEAWQFLGPQAGKPTPEWLSAAFADGRAWYQGGDAPYITIGTLEGEMRANLGDWIIHGIEKEIYPCKPNIFAATYEPAE